MFVAYIQVQGGILYIVGLRSSVIMAGNTKTSRRTRRARVQQGKKQTRHSQTPQGLMRQRSRKVHLNRGDEKGTTALMRACLRGNENRVKNLIVSGVQVDDCDDNGESALMHACLKGHEAIVELLLQANAEVGMKDDKYGMGALMLACENGHDGIVSMLLAAGADANACDNAGFTVLMEATRKGCPYMVHKLLQYGADPNRRENSSRCTALMIASYHGDQDIAEDLIDCGADVNKHNRRKYYLLFFLLNPLGVLLQKRCLYAIIFLIVLLLF